MQSGHLQRSGVSALKWKIRLALQARQLFGSRSLSWTFAEKSRCSKRLLTEMARERNNLVSMTIKTERYQPLLQAGEPWGNVLEIAQQLHGLGATLVLQGSQADGTTTGFSDIDLVLLGNPANLQQQQLKNQLDRIVLGADPLQHHGVFFYDQKLLYRYSESILPLDTFRKATAIAESVELKFLLLNDKYSPACTLVSFVKTLETYLQRELAVRGMWDWKFRVSQFLLIPALLAAVRQRFLYKGDSFRFAAHLYSKSAWRVIEELTRVREQWQVPNEIGESDPYHDAPKRHLGQLDRDPWPVTESLAVWKEKSFREKCDSFSGRNVKFGRFSMKFPKTTGVNQNGGSSTL